MSAEVLQLRPEAAKDRVWEVVSHNLRLHRPTGFYYVRKSKAGLGRLFESTGLQKKGAAQSKADEMMAEWMGGRRGSRKRPRIRDLIPALDLILEREAVTRGNDGQLLRRARTREKDAHYFKLVDKLFGDTFADDWDEARWQRWCLTDGRRLGRNLGDIAKYLSKILTYAYMTKAIGRKPRIKNPDAPPREKVLYTPEQIQLFWENSNEDLRDLIVLGAEAGLRPDENTGIHRDWCSIEPKGEVLLKIPDDFEKRGEGREIYLSKAASAVVLRRLKSHSHPYLFPSPADPNRPLSRVRRSRYWMRAVRAVNVKLIEAKQKPFPVGRKAGGIKFHWFRHFFFNTSLETQKIDKVASYGGNNPKTLFKAYVSKTAKQTRGLASAVNLGLGKS